MEFEKISVDAKVYDLLYLKIKDLQYLTFEETDDKFGLKFVETVKQTYIFEVRDKGKYLMAKLIYDI